jgi:hypothetical protein
MTLVPENWVRIVLAALLLSPAVASAVAVTDLYETAQPIQGTAQDAAFAEALKTVVIRVSGRRDAPAQLGSALANPRQFVQRYGVTSDNVLQVGFDDVSIDNLLLGAGLPLWGRERPAVLVVLNLEDVGGGWASTEVAPGDKERIARVARERGLPVQWGALDAQDQNLLSMNAGADALLQIAERNGANAVLAGRGRRDSGMQWTLATTDGSSEGGGALEDGIHLAADTFAKVFATAGSSLTHVNVEVAGIADLNAYATTLNYLEGMTLIRNVALEQVSGDTLRFRLAVRGNAETLRRAIALDDRLVPSDAVTSASGVSDAGARLAFRYRP